MKDQVNKMRWVVFLLLVVSLVFAGAALAMAEEGVLGADEVTDTTVSTEPVGTVEDQAPPEVVPGEDPVAADTAPDPASVEEPVTEEASPLGEAPADDGMPNLVAPSSFIFTYFVGSEETSTTVALERDNNHGAYVSAVAKLPLEDLKHGLLVRQIAQSDWGKKGFG